MNEQGKHDIDYTQIPQACTDYHAALRRAGFPIDNLIPEIISDDNLSDGFDYVISHLECEEQRDKYWPKKDKMLSTLKRQICNGTFRILPKDIKEMTVDDGPKVRVVQAPRVYYRIGCHVIMVIVEKYTNPTLITNTAASIKGRGMHWLFHRIEEDYAHRPDLMQYFLANDIEHFYDNISQTLMMQEIRRYICDPVLLPMLDSFITLLPDGLSKGLRSSQCFANLIMSPVDHVMCANVKTYTLEKLNVDGGITSETRYMYQRYMDDGRWRDGDKRELWKLSELYHAEIGKIGLHVKPSEAIRPISEGDDFLGFVFYGDHARLRKRTKQKAARKLARVKSRKRRQEIVGSFKGMACHADCKHLYYKLTHHHMKKFGELGIVYQPDDGKKRFPGKVTPIGKIQNKLIEIHDYETDIKTSNGEGRYLVSFRDVRDNSWGKFFTASKELQNILDQISDIEDGFPFETTIIMDMYDGKSIPKFT